MSALMTVDLSLVFVAAGMPKPEREYRFHETRKWRFDYSWVEYRVAVERMGDTWRGGRHTRGQGYRDDAEKLAEAQIAGWLVLYVTSDMLRDGSAYGLLERALKARGWEGGSR